MDTNVLLDVVTGDPNWAEWSQQQLEAASLRDQLAINAIIYAELSIRYDRIEDVDAVVAGADLVLAEIPRSALFLAGKAFQTYRKRGGGRAGVLPDFFVGAHAAVSGMPLVTRDIGRYRTYYPGLELIAPDSGAA